MRGRFVLVYLLLLFAQILFGNFLSLGPYVCICILPLLILKLPIRYSGWVLMAIAFVSGLVVDFFTHGVLGLSVIAILPVAFCRRWVISLVFGGEVFARGEDISAARQGLPKMALAVLLNTALFFVLYVWIDAAGTRTFGFNALRMLCSTLASTVVEIFLIVLLNGWEADRWK